METFRAMRRFKQALSRAECDEILTRGRSGVLAISGDGGYPYALPISYLYRENALYFHCARQGHKLDAAARCDKASFCVVDRDEIIPERYTTHYKSVIAFGRLRLLNENELLEPLIALAQKYSPDDPCGCRREAEGSLGRVALLRLEIEHMTGKQAIELVGRE